ncbi:2-nitropropane dioxygenase [Dictyobacter alpinus]|uniref:2-nitropropane dioxygenase n=1 Tax=Dictyobacter alpinus TaxID=2014873 RepID=A0A402BGC9_9CHLR|nr:nitronate monooxygenase [Dictyobacter alpinus]GCE30425.1 2-nitropropane dioxygenase [Dictyobacter alpinus]
MLRTRLTEEYGIELPFVSAGMAFIGMPPLVAAVSNAGGMGTLGASLVPPDDLRTLIHMTRSMTTRPFGVNFITPFIGEPHIAVCIEEKVAVVSFFWGDPPETFIQRLHTAGIKVWMQVGSLAEARTAVRSGVDAVVAQGSEAGGHNRSTATSLTLIPAVVDAIAPIPVIAAGGIADGRGVVAALALGAEAVWVGTRMVASQEAYANEEYKKRIVAAEGADTVRTTIFGPEWPHQPMRVIRNRVVEEWAGQETRVVYDPNPTTFIGQTRIGGQEVPLPKFSALLPTPDTTGDWEEMCFTAGECSGLINEVKPAADIVHEMMEEARQIIRYRLNHVLHSPDGQATSPNA